MALHANMKSSAGMIILFFSRPMLTMGCFCFFSVRTKRTQQMTETTNMAIIQGEFQGSWLPPTAMATQIGPMATGRSMTPL